MPYNIRYLARETLIALRVSFSIPTSFFSLFSLQEKYPDAPDTLYAACIGRLVYYRYINPAIVCVRLNICGFTG